MAAPEEQPTTHEEIIGTCVDDETPEVAVAAWMKEQVEKEIQRFASMGHKSIALPVKNMGIVMDGQTCVNRVELDTNFDFNKIRQIQIAEPVACPHKDGYNFLFVLLISTSPIPLVMPYLYQRNRKNKLQHWIFINNKLERSRHKIEGFQ
eukprot:TRINITY_DN5390_c0_g1_i2.p2 TRINITY_DN5390_c0_g1~~TRINITY_DN5390_c0_g1_i2.p2  ORF type:complete len:167 (-),score=33.69 TRINITY_DN5390_c0_g1_i2:49-498(-)